MNPSEILFENAKKLAVFIAPILAYKRGETSAANWKTGGTVFFARCGTSRFLVTADHVISAIDELRLEDDIVIMVGGNNCSPVNISTWPILDRDNFVDICTIEVPADFDESCLNKQFFDLIDWPHQAASENDVGFIIGFPGQHRSGEERSVITRILPICDFVTDVGPRKFTIADEHNERQVLLDLAKLGVPETYGGMSGSPVFRLREMGRPDFIGVFTSGSDGINAAFFCSHANFIASDGRLDHRRIPPR